jgi:predicted RNA-binding Zn ribbon-like protein
MSDGGKQSEFVFELSGGALCLDFANTVYSRPVPERRTDHLATYGDLIAWSRQSGLIGAKQALELRRLAAIDPAASEAVRRRGVSLREAIYQIFSAIAAGQEPGAGDLNTLNEYVADALHHMRLTRATHGYKLDWCFAKDEFLAHLLWPIARSAADLLTSERIARVRECAAETCDWLFLDNSRGQSRRWCDMKVCGNRAKARRFILRAKAKHRANKSKRVFLE